MYLIEKNEPATKGQAKNRSDAALEDEILLARIEAGDQKAYTLLVQRYVGKIWRLAMSILKNEAEAEDAVQDVFVSLLQSLKKWDPNGQAKFSTWIYRVSFNKCIDLKRKRKYSDCSDDMDMRSSDKNAYQETFDSQISEKLTEHLSNLPDAQKAALLLYYYEELSVEEIAIELDNTTQGIRSLLKRGKAALRDKMQYDQTFKSNQMSELIAHAVV
jgi:RNA polymerase sigma-70 factor (ECF subfamily)